ncbi:MAG: hypothetical protein VX372_05000 [Verrucomicrobiota bacterium]|nr:hypothetical protein [Verrucomicrobiota bacterium]MEE2988912.1 hypothetical protein [Verrucomicrobiota bacterium]
MIDSKAADKEMCEVATSQGEAISKNVNIIKVNNQIIVKSADLDTDIH